MNWKDKVFPALKIIASLWIISSLAAMFFSMEGDIGSGNVAVIPIHGFITVSEGSSFTSGIISSDTVIEHLDNAASNPNIKAIILDINSPGGSGVAADEISQKIKSIDKATVAVIREIGASAAYWIAASTDYSFSNRISLVGSIGVIGSYLDFSDFIKEYNVTYQRFVSGELKDMLSPFREPTKEEKEIFQKILDDLHMIFVEEVAQNRNMSIEEVEKLATGEIFIGTQAEKLNLVDYVGTKQDAVEFIEKKLNISAQLVEYKKKKGLSELLSEFKPEIGKFINPIPNNFMIR